MLFVIILVLIYLVIASNAKFLQSSQWQGNLTPARFGAMSLGDIDNDGDLDVISTGCLDDGANDCENGVIAKIYINNGTSLIENLAWEQNLTGVGLSSVAFGDIDNDGDLDLALTGCDRSTSFNCNGNRFAKIYLNNGTSLVESNQWQNNLTPVTEGSLSWADVNNDGKLDLAQIGERTTLPYLIAKVYINNGTSLAESSQWEQNLTGVQRGNIAFGDVNNDRKLDLVLGGYKETVTEVTKIYINNGTSLIESQQWQQSLTQMGESSVLWGDYDNDGDLDLVMNGHTTGDRFHIYNNNGTTLVLNQTDTVQGGVLAGLYSSSVAFGDIDNDGDLDLVGMGWEHGRTKMYENNNTIFQDDIEVHTEISDNIYEGSLAFGDIDNDGDLDLTMFGYDFPVSLVFKVYLNNITISNTKPNPPNLSFSATYVNNILTLSWGNGSDAETNTSGLYYNLRVGNSTQNNSIISGVYGGESGSNEGGGGGANGYFGNMMQRKSISLNLQLEANKTYNWYVQTIDTGLAKSNWSSVQNFITSIDVTKPNITINYPSPNDSLHTTNPYFVFNAAVSDANLTNVTLYADWTGSMIANETNSSGINTTYIFIRNLTNYNDSMYSWYIYACDSIGNCQTSGRSFYLDRSYPIVRLISPADTGSWTSSNIVTFSYNVTDTDIANCSLIVNNAVVDTSTSVNEDITQEFTYSLSNGNYNWQVNCTDYVNFTNSSSIYSLTVNYVPSSSSTGGGGGGTSGITSKIYSITETQIKTGYTQILSKNDKIQFSVDNKNHSLTLNNLNTSLNYANLTLSSSLINFLIYINEEKKFNLTSNNYYDTLVRLNNLENNKANLTIKQIYEEIKVEGEKKAEEEKIKQEEKKQAGKKLKENLMPILTIAGIVILIIILILYINYKKRKARE